MKGLILLIIYLVLTSFIKQGKYVKPTDKYEKYKANQDLEKRRNTFDSSVQRKQAQRAYEKARNKGKSFVDSFDKAFNPAPKYEEKKNSSTYIFEKSRKTKKEENKAYSMKPDYLEPEVLQAQRIKEYELSLYGKDEENPMFDYDYEEISRSDDDLDWAILPDGPVKVDLKDAIIMSEILAKPKALRKN